MYNCAHLRSTKESLTFEYFETVGTGWYSTTLLCLYILKKVEIWSEITIAGRTMKEGKIEVLSHWTIDGWDEQLTDCTQDDQRSGFEEKNPPARVGRSLAGSNQRLMWVPMIIAGRAAVHHLGLKPLWICFEILYWSWSDEIHFALKQLPFWI